MRLQVTAGGTSITTGAITVEPALPELVAPPALAGAPGVGATITVVPGTWLGADTVTRSIFSCAQDLVTCEFLGDSSIVLTEAERGRMLYVAEIAGNIHGPSDVRTTPIGPVVDPLRKLAEPALTGVADVGGVLSFAAGLEPGDGIAYAWARCATACTPVAGAGADTYAVTEADRGFALQVVATATNAAGSITATATSATVPLPAVPALPAGTPPPTPVIPAPVAPVPKPARPALRARPAVTGVPEARAHAPLHHRPLGQRAQALCLPLAAGGEAPRGPPARPIACARPTAASGSSAACRRPTAWAPRRPPASPSGCPRSCGCRRRRHSTPLGHTSRHAARLHPAPRRASQPVRRALPALDRSVVWETPDTGAAFIYGRSHAPRGRRGRGRARCAGGRGGAPVRRGHDGRDLPRARRAAAGLGGGRPLAGLLRAAARAAGGARPLRRRDPRLRPARPRRVRAGLLRGASLAVVETPANPLLSVVDIRAAAAVAREAGALLVCDNTVATPLHQRPLDLGADLSWYSGTKLFGGHHDLIAGVLVGRDPELLGRVRDVRRMVGGVLAPDPAWLLARGLRTLHLRVPRQSANALALAEHLAQHPGSSDALRRAAVAPGARDRGRADARRLRLPALVRALRRGRRRLGHQPPAARPPGHELRRRGDELRTPWPRGARPGARGAGAGLGRRGGDRGPSWPTGIRRCADPRCTVVSHRDDGRRRHGDEHARGDPSGGHRVRFVVDAATSGGSVTAFECSIAPAATMPAAHSHDAFEETIYGLSGRPTFVVDGVPHEIGPGDALCIRRGQVHHFRNDGTGEAVVLCVITPGLLGPAYFEEIRAVVAASAGGPPDRAAMGEVMLRHGLTPAPPTT